MKLDEWGNIIVSWANFLDPNEEIGNLEDLSKSDLFTRLLGVLHSPFEPCSHDTNELCTFLQEKYPSLDLDEAHLENKQGTILQATAFLIYCSLHHEENELRMKMTELPNWTQLCLTDFLQEFVDIPKSEITQALIFSEISKIQSSRIPESVKNSPSFGTPVMYTSSPSTGEGSKTLSSSKKTSKVRRLRKEIEILVTMKGELTEELEAAKECITKLESTVQKKDQDINKLKMEIKKMDNKEHICELPPSHITENTKIEKLKTLIEKLEEEKSALEYDLIAAREEKNSMYEELQRVKSIVQNAEIERKISQEEKMDLESQIKEHKMALEQLSVTNKEQAEYINELTRPRDDSKTFSDSHGDSLILPESLGQHVIDLEIKELQDIIESKESLIKDLESEIQEKLSTNENLKLNLTKSEENYLKALEDFSCKEKSFLKEIELKSLENDVLQKFKKDMVEQCSGLMDKVKDLEYSINSKESTISQFIAEKAELETEIKNVQNELQSQIRNKNLFISELNTQIEHLNDQISVKNDNIENLQHKLSLSKEDLEKLSNDFIQLQKQSKEFSERIAVELSEQNKNIKELERLTTSLNAELTESKEQYHSLQAQADCDLAKLRSELKQSNCRELMINNSLNDLKKSMSETIQQKETDILHLKSKLDSNEEKIKTYENETAALQKVIMSKESDLSKMESLLESTNEQFEVALKAKDVELKEKINCLNDTEERFGVQSKLNIELESQVQCLNSVLEDQSRSIMKYEEEMEILERKISTLMIAAEEKDSVIISLQASLDSQKEEILGLKGNQNQLSEELQSRISYIKTLEKEISEMKEAEANYCHDRNTFLRIIEDKENELQEHIKKHQKVQADFESKIQCLQTNLNEKTKICKNLEKDKLISNQDLASSREWICVLENKLKEKEEKILLNCTIIEKLESDASNYMAEKQEIFAKMNSYEEKIKEMDDTCLSKNSLICDMENRIQCLSSQYTSVIAEKQNLDELLTKNVEIIKSLEQKLSDKEQLISEKEEQKSKELSEFNRIIDELKSSTTESDLELTELKKEKEHLNNELNNKTALITSYESKIKLIESGNQAVNEENQSLLKKIISNGEFIAELEDKLKKYQSEISELIECKTNLLVEIQTLVEKSDFQGAKIEQLLNEISEYKEKQSSLSGEIKDKEATIITLKGSLKELEESFKVQQDKCIGFERETSTLQDLVSRYENKTRNLEGILEDRDKAFKTQEALVNELNEKIRLLQNAEFSMKENLEKKEKCVSELTFQICSLEEEIKNKNTENDKLTGSIETMKQEIQEHLNSMKSLQDSSHEKCLTLNIEIERFKTACSDLETEKEQLKSEIQNMALEKDGLISRIKTLEMEHDRCGEKAQYAESVIHELKDKEKILKEELYKSNKREISLESEVSNKNTRINDLQEEMKSLQKALQDHEFEEGILFTKLQAKETEVNQLMLELNDVNKRLKTTEERHLEETQMYLQKISDLDSTIGLLNNQFIKINIEKESLITELEDKKATEKELKLLQSEFASLKGKSENLEKELILKNKSISDLEGWVSSLQGDSEILKSEKSELANTVDKNAKELNSLKERIQELQDSISLGKMRETDLINEISSKNNLISSLEQKIAESVKVNDEMSSELSSLKEIISNKDTLLEKYAKDKNVLMLDLDLHLKKEEVLNSQLESKIKEVEDVRSMFKQAEVEASKLKLKCSEQELTLRGLYATLHSQNAELKEKETEVVLLQQGIKNVNQQLLEEKRINPKDPRPVTEGEEAPVIKTEPGQLTEEQVKARIEQVKSSYEKKIESYKATMKKRFTEKLEDLTYTLQNENIDLKEKLMKEQERCNKLQEQCGKVQEQCSKLQSELWNASDKLLITQEQNRTLLSKIQARNIFEVVRPTEALSPISKARSMEVLSGRNRGIDNFARDISFNESDCSSRRSSIRSLPRGMGKVFPAAEEDGEVFDNRYLADLKAGVCNIPYDPDRMSTLQYRNSLCPPHLKSSYPAETQFITGDLREDDIKSGTRLAASNSENDVRKIKIQSSYKKPGPPTPSKHGGHSSSQGNEMKCPMTPKTSKGGKEGVVNECFILRDGNARKSEIPQPRTFKVSTPSRLKALFTSKKDENSPRRKSMFVKKN